MIEASVGYYLLTISLREECLVLCKRKKKTNSVVGKFRNLVLFTFRRKMGLHSGIGIC